MKREILVTADGSKTILLTEWQEHYHSKHGAIQEAYHVFIKHGLSKFYDTKNVSLLEVGFGTGLNAFITFLEAEKQKININYVGVEAYPIYEEEVVQLNYVSELKAEKYSEVFKKMHSCSWGEKHKLSENFTLEKRVQFFENIDDNNTFDLIYFDAFGARVQPDLWAKSIFEKMYFALRPNGILVTYSAKGSVRRAMLEVGFTVEKLIGPKGKREMLRAIKK